MKALLAVALMLRAIMCTGEEAATWTLEAIPRITADQVRTPAEFFDRWGDTPVIITGLTETAPALQVQDLVDICPEDAHMPIWVKTDDPGEWARIRMVEQIPLSEFAQRLSALDFQGYGFDFDITFECPALLDRLTAPSFARDDLIGGMRDSDGNRVYHWPSLMSGPKATYSELHTDNDGLPFYMALHSGKKHWRVLSYGKNLHLTQEPHQNNDFGDPLPTVMEGPFRSHLLPQYLSDGESGYNFQVFDPDFAEFPELSQAHVYDGILSEGETIWIPNSAAHAATNLETTVATTANFFARQDPRQSAWAVRVCERWRGVQRDEHNEVGHERRSAMCSLLEKENSRTDL
eukprot:TRINITY_DN5030_c0_g1_i2.p1 TRINITY_DN5030_c0_g1~~TRINITY_DN5030_c0_g1_i2.p1  ORF type:complete len:348 (+),score=48.53 TRINITY_DN5030_c0_g1_i2:147-1190(+)